MAVMNVKMYGDDKVSRIVGGARAFEDLQTGKLIIYDVNGNVIAKRDLHRVTDWWPEESSTNGQQERIDAAVRTVEAALKPDVVRIRYSIGTDWSDEPAVYFRVVLSDDAAAHRLREIAREVRERLNDRLDFSALGVRPYHHFRSESEQAALKEEAWA
jgi:hypothetical protein